MDSVFRLFSTNIYLYDCAILFPIDSLSFFKNPYTATSKVGLFHYFSDDHPHNLEQEEMDPQYDYMTVALLSLILGLGTAVGAIALRAIRFSSFCCNDFVRSVVTDFA